jgi:hypothetical protein
VARPASSSQLLEQASIATKGMQTEAKCWRPSDARRMPAAVSNRHLTPAMSGRPLRFQARGRRKMRSALAARRSKACHGLLERVVGRVRFFGLCLFDADLMTMRVERVRGKVTPECLMAALNSAWISW